MHHSISEFTAAITLHDVSLNLPVRIKALNAEPAVCQRLREMGFCEFAEVRKVAHGAALICRVCDPARQSSLRLAGGVKIALSQYLARNILVETISSPRLPADSCPDQQAGLPAHFC